MNMTYADIQEYKRNAVSILKKNDQHATARAVEIAFSALIALDQYRWERDVAIKQLEEIGCGLGENMDAIKKRLESRPRGEWIKFGYKWKCVNCEKKINIDGTPEENGLNFCPNCGASMQSSAK